MAVRQDGSDSDGKTAATEAAVAAQTWIGSGGRAVVRQHRVGRNSYGRSELCSTMELGKCDDVVYM